MSNELSNRYFNIIIEILKPEEPNKKYQEWLNNINK